MRAVLVGLAVLAAAGFAALGVWQIERRAWKLDLIARVDARIHAPAAAIPDPARWRDDLKAEEYRRVRLSGAFLNDRETLVQALTERGGGYWVLTPLRTQAGIVLVNRGFVPPEKRAPAARGAAASGPVTITGLLRISEPEGTLMRANDPANDRWFSRDVAAIAQARGLGPVAPFFIDADATANPGGYPVGGLTVVQFRNNHLIYAITWFALALLSVGAVWMLARSRPEQH